MTYLTLAILATNDGELHIEPVTKEGKWGYWITLGVYHRPVVNTNEFPYTSQGEAEQEAHNLIAECKTIYAGQARS